MLPNASMGNVGVLQGAGVYFTALLILSSQKVLVIIIFFFTEAQTFVVCTCMIDAPNTKRFPVIYSPH